MVATFTIFVKMAHNTFDKHNFSDKQIEDFRHAFEFFDKVSSYLIIDFAVETKQHLIHYVSIISIILFCVFVRMEMEVSPVENLSPFFGD